MLGDDAGAAPPIKGVCRSASIALRKANLAKETGDEDEELAQLRSFNRTVVNVLRLHPMYARKKQDEEVAGLDAKLPEVHRRMEALGGKVAPPAENISEAAGLGRRRAPRRGRGKGVAARTQEAEPREQPRGQPRAERRAFARRES
jgi:hypothetical protein